MILSESFKGGHMYQLELDDLQTNDELKDTFDAKDSVKFYAGLTDSKFSSLKKLAAAMITVLSSTHVCEQTCSRMKFKLAFLTNQ